MDWVWLPGMDGTGRLFDPIVAIGEGQPIAHPLDAWDYDDLDAHVRRQLPATDFVLVAESFSGPLGIRIAASPPPGLVGLALIATFARSPVLRTPLPEVLLRRAFAVPPPPWAVRRWMLGTDAPPSAVDAVRQAIAEVPPVTLARRLRAIQRVDVTASLDRIACPWLYLQATGDRLVGASALGILRAHRPDLPVEQIAGPHLLAQSRPDAVLATLIRHFG